MDEFVLGVSPNPAKVHFVVVSPGMMVEEADVDHLWTSVLMRRDTLPCIRTRCPHVLVHVTLFAGLGAGVSYDVREMWLANGVEDLEMHDIASSGPGASKSAGGDGKGVASLTAGGNVHNGSRRSGMESVLYGGEGQVSPSSDMISDIAEDGPGGGDGSAAFSGDSSSRFVIPEFQCKEMACEVRA